MKLYLSSVDIPNPKILSELLGKSLDTANVALIPNAKDYYSNRAWQFTVDKRIEYMNKFGFNTKVIDLRKYSNATVLKNDLSNYDLIWAMGGNTFILRYEMRRSGFDEIIRELLDDGKVYGGDSAGALVAGISINGIEDLDEPQFAEQVISSGLGLMPFSILPHVDDAELTEIIPLFRKLHSTEEIIELKDAQAFVFDNGDYRIVTGQT